MMAVGQFLMFMSASSLNNTDLAHWLMYGGLGFMILGNGCFKPTVSSLVGQLYEPGTNGWMLHTPFSIWVLM